MSRRGDTGRALAIVLLATVWLAGCATPPAPPPPPPPPPVAANGGPRNGGPRMSGSEFLLPGQTESTAPRPYGLYSYLLFGSAPSEAARPRYLEAIRAYLTLLQPVRELEREGASRDELNVTYLPVDDRRAVAAAEAADPAAAEMILEHYHYARARILLNKVVGGPHLDGPYLVSFREPLGKIRRLSGDYGWIDMSTVPAGRVSRWVRIFLRETARQNYWEPDRPRRVWTAMLDELARAGEGAPEVLEAVAFWVPGR